MLFRSFGSTQIGALIGAVQKAGQHFLVGGDHEHAMLNFLYQVQALQDTQSDFRTTAVQIVDGDDNLLHRSAVFLWTGYEFFRVQLTMWSLTGNASRKKERKH